MGNEKRTAIVKITVLLLLFVMIIGGGSLIGIVMFQGKIAEINDRIEDLNSKFDELNNSIDEHAKDISDNKRAVFRQQLNDIFKNQIDFTSTNVQDIGDGFSVVRLEMAEHLTGIKFSGRVINTQSIRHRNVEFKIEVGEKEKTFTINTISAGNSTGFSVYVPDIKPEDAHYGSIKFISSTCEYYIMAY